MTPLHRSGDLTRVTRPQGAPADTDEALARWQAQRDALVDPASTDSREEQLVSERTLSAFEREREALDRWLKQVADEPEPTQPSVLVVHRHEWLQRRLSTELGVRGWRVLDGQDQSCEAVAALVVHQPQLLVLSDRIAGGSGLELVSRARVLSPGTAVVVQVDQDSRCPAFVEAGADVVVSHRSTWQQLVAVIDELAPEG